MVGFLGEEVRCCGFEAWSLVGFGVGGVAASTGAKRQSQLLSGAAGACIMAGAEGKGDGWLHYGGGSLRAELKRGSCSRGDERLGPDFVRGEGIRRRRGVEAGL